MELIVKLGIAFLSIIIAFLSIIIAIIIAYVTARYAIKKELNLTKYSILQICIRYFHHIDMNSGNLEENRKKVFIQELESIFDDLKTLQYTNYFNRIFKNDPQILALLMNFRREISEHVTAKKHFSYQLVVFLQFYDLYKIIKKDLDKKLLKKKYFIKEDELIMRMHKIINKNSHNG